METPAPYTEFGQKGIGESGAIGSAAAIANAVNDALRPLGVQVDQLPISPRVIVEAMRSATPARAAKGMPA
jgi:carbon-monoxide dehydrogenase large subunit